jgi:hypothetical protein
MGAILVSGTPARVSAVAAALRGRRAEVTEVTDLADVPEVCAAAGAGAFDAYIQLPATFQIEGKTAIQRVHHFYSCGVLARFTALDAALPSLAPGARLTFVLGTLLPETATDDDVEARRALTRILADAARADTADGQLIVRVLDAGTDPDVVAQVALGLDPGRNELMERLADLSYDDWRTELLGLAAVQT